MQRLSKLQDEQSELCRGEMTAETGCESRMAVGKGKGSPVRKGRVPGREM